MKMRTSAPTSGELSDRLVAVAPVLILSDGAAGHYRKVKFRQNRNHRGIALNSTIWTKLFVPKAPAFLFTHYGPNLRWYSPETMNALTSSASTKLPLN